MPIASSSTTYALVIVSLGILGIIVSFLIQDKRKYVTALLLSLLVVGMGLFQFVGTSLKAWRTKQHIESLQQRQRVSLEMLQNKLREAGEKGTPSAAPAPATQPAAAPAPVHKKKR